MGEYTLYRGQADWRGTVQWQDVGNASTEKEADDACRTAVRKFVDGRSNYVVYPLGPRGTREFGQPQLPFPSGNTYMVSEIGNEQIARATFFNWKQVK